MKNPASSFEFRTQNQNVFGDFAFPNADDFLEAADRTDATSSIERKIEEFLLAPVRNLTARPSKSFRARLVQCGAMFARASDVQGETGAFEENLLLCQQAVELLHTGSLIIDDIQDHSMSRRGSPSLHQVIGIPRAITCGNWLYIWPMRLLRKHFCGDNFCKQLIGELFVESLEAAHYGQALDVGIEISTLPQAEVVKLCDWVSRRKTGTVTALALQMGAVCAGADEVFVRNLHAIGVEFGNALQRFDDLGNAKGLKEAEKRWEDFHNRRPSWLWASASILCTPLEYEGFVNAVSALPSEQPLEDWLAQHDLVTRSETLAIKLLDDIFVGLEQTVDRDSDAYKTLAQLGEQIKHAYTTNPPN